MPARSVHLVRAGAAIAPTAKYSRHRQKDKNRDHDSRSLHHALPSVHRLGFSACGVDVYAVDYYRLHRRLVKHDLARNVEAVVDAGTKPRRGKGITREALIAAALEIVDREGIAALSMRRLGAELGVDPMAAYRHLPNKEALLDGVVEAVVTEIDLDVDPSLPWQDQLRTIIDADLRAMLAHPNVLPLVAQRPLTTPESLKLVEKGLEILDGAGVPRHDALLAINVMGFMITSQAVAMSAAAADSRTAEDLLAIFASLPAEEFPLIADSIARGQFVEGYDQLLGFWVDALLAKLQDSIGSAQC